MKQNKKTNRLAALATFLVAFLLITLPISTSAQLSAATTVAAAEGQPRQLPNEAEASYLLQGESGVEPQVWCLWPAKECAGKCSWCGIGSTWYCSSTGGVCCDSSAKFCDSSAGKCWADNCPAGTKWTCKSTGAVCESVCTNPSYPTYCGGQCWTSCPDDQYRTYKFVCANPPWCQVVSCIHSSYPNKCNNNCWNNCRSDENFICPSSGNPYCVSKCTDNDGDGYGSGCSKGSDCNDNNANINPGKSETCNGVDDDCDGLVDENVKNACGGCGSVPSETCDGKDNDCDGLTDEGGVCCTDKDGDGYGSGCSSGSDCNDNDASINPGKAEVCGDAKDNNCNGSADENCCPANSPYYCQKTEPKPCWDKKERCDSSLKCGGEWWACTEPSKYNVKCVDSKPGCCLPQYPYYCPDNNYCFTSDGYCDGREVYTCLGKSQVCDKKTDVGTCFGDVLRCCPSGETWWESDKQCHKSSEPQKCSVPDGSSANCDCDSDSDCPSSSGKPYCGEGGSLYDVRTPQGYHACLSAKPEYCGNGNCNTAKGENYNNCISDCGQNAPKGTVNVNVYNPNTQAAVSGARISVDSIFGTTTDANGKAAITASYGNRNVKVECQDNKLCETRTIKVDGEEYANFACNCNPTGDSDSDGYSDKDEGLLGTNPNDASSNFGSTFASDSVDLLACIPTPASFFILWKEYKKSGSIIQSHSLVVNSLNTTSITSASLDGGPYFVAQALAAAGFEAEGAEVIVNPVNVTLENVMKKAEYVDGVRMQDGILLIATDKDGQTTALIAIGAGCVGAFTGTVYGIGQGLFDDIKGVIDGIWFIITHLDDVKKIWGGAVELVNGIRELFGKPGEAFWSMFTGILEKGRGINLFRDDRVNNPDAYRHFQVGFVYGFVTGYLVEQVALGAAILTKVAKAFKIGQLFGKIGKATKLMEKLNIIKASEEFGAEIAEKLSKLKYLKEGIENWADSEIKGLARIMKHNEGWLKGLSEAEAKIAAKRVDNLVTVRNIADDDIKKVLDTNIGRKTLAAVDTSEELVAKQAKLVSKWGTSQLEEVAKRYDGFWPWQKNGWVKLNRLLDNVPLNVVDDLSSSKAIKYLGNEKLLEAMEKVSKSFSASDLSAVVKTFDDFESVSIAAEKVLKYVPDFKSLQKFTNDFPPHLEMLRDLGKLQDVSGFDKLVRNIAIQGGGFPYEARRAAILKDTPGVKLVELGRKKNIKFIDIDGSQKIRELDMDIFYEFLHQGKKIRVMEEIKSSSSGVVGATNEFKTQILKMTQAVKDGAAEQARAVTHGTFANDVKTFIQQNGNLVELVEGGI